MLSELTQIIPDSTPTTSNDALQLKAFTDAAADSVARAIAGVQREAERAEQLRQAEYRAFFAEQRETVGELMRRVEGRLAEVKDGRDGVDGKDGMDGRDADMVALSRRLDELIASIPIPQDGKDGRDGQDVDLDAVGLALKEEVRRAVPEILEEAIRRSTELLPIIVTEKVAEAVAEIPIPKDGIDGKDADMDALTKKVEEWLSSVPMPSNGTDGADAYPGEARGLFDPEAEYRAMDVVSFNGSEWRAKRDDPGLLPGDGWMLSASKGKRGERGPDGRIGKDGKDGKDGANPIELKFDAEKMMFVMALDDGNVLEADFYPVAKAIRGD